MFKCKDCKKVSPQEKQYKIPVIIRKVIYLLQVKVNDYNQDTLEKSEPLLKTVGKSNGFEIVKEDVYCKKCIPKENNPRILKDEVTRSVLVKSRYNKKEKENRDE